MIHDLHLPSSDTCTCHFYSYICMIFMSFLSRMSPDDFIPVIILLLITMLTAAVLPHCVPKKTCDHIFDDKLKWNCLFTEIFATLTTKSTGHRQVFLVSHLTYFVQLLYPGKLSRPKYHEFSVILLIFSMLQYKDINCKIVTILYCLLMIQLSVYNRTITRRIADDNVVYQ